MDAEPKVQYDPERSDEEQQQRLIRRVLEMLRAQDPNWVEQQVPPSPSQLALLFEQAQLVANAANDYFERPVHAYQLFEPNGPMLTARFIEARFEKAGWTGKGWGHVTLRKKIETLLRLASIETDRRVQLRAGLLTGGLHGSGSLRKLHDEIQSGVSTLFDRLRISDAVARADELKQAAVAALEKLIDVELKDSDQRSHSEDPGASFAIRSFMDFVCGYDNVLDFCKSGPDKPVRAYELFLFATQYNHFRETFTATVANRSQIVSPVYRSSISILEAHGGVDAAIDRYLKNKTSLNERIGGAIKAAGGNNRASAAESKPPTDPI